MVERIPDLPPDVLGFTAKGHVTADDYESVIIPAVEEALARHSKVCFLYHLGADFEGFDLGALWDDAKLGMKHLSGWEKLAIVSDVEWIRTALRVLRFAIPAEARLFHDRELAEAKQWIAE